MEKHITILGILHIAYSIMGFFGALIVFAAVAGGGLISGDDEVIAITTIVGSGIAFLLLLVSVPGLIGGIGLLKWQPWARILALIIGGLNLINIPFGTALGIYTIWVLINDESIQLFTSKS